MGDETIRILGMLEEGKISSEEAVQLIEALKNETSSKIDKESNDRNSHYKKTDFKFKWDNLLNLGKYMNEAFGQKAEFSEEKEWFFDAQGISTIDVEAMNGNITVTGSEENQIIVKARKIVRASSDAMVKEIAEQVETVAEPLEDRLHISTEQPKTLFNTTIKVHYDVLCPGVMDLNLLSKNGKINVKEIDGVLKLATINGKIRLESIRGSANVKATNGKIYTYLKELKSDLKLSTLNGSIETHILSGNAPIALKTMNGSIRLILPDDFSGQIDAKIVHGKIRSDYPITTKDFGKRHLTGQIGSGSETPIYLRTKNGSIDINKANPENMRSN